MPLAEHLVVQRIALTRPYNHVEAKRGCRNPRSKSRCPTTTDTQAAPSTAVPCSQTTYKTINPRNIYGLNGLNKRRLFNISDGAHRHRIQLHSHPMTLPCCTGLVSKAQPKDNSRLCHSTRLGSQQLLLSCRTNLPFHSILRQRNLQGLGSQHSRLT